MGDETPHWSDDASLRWAPDPAHAFATAAADAPPRKGPWSLPEAARATPAPINIAQLWPQLLSIVAVFVYCSIVTFIILKVVDLIVGLRVTREVEIEGLDVNLHGETVHS